MMDFSYFEISRIIAYGIIGLTIPIFVVRLLRAFPFYVKNGHVGDIDNTILFMFIRRPNLVECKKVLHGFLTETHPSAILQDVLATFVIGCVLSMAWIVVPPVTIFWFMLRYIIKLAKRMRKQHIKKDEFLDTLKGDITNAGN